jgi:Flp pilus assembly protein TadG
MLQQSAGFLSAQKAVTHPLSHPNINRLPMHALNRPELSDPSRRRRQPTVRRGAVTLEVILALPALLIATIAVFEFGFIMLVHQAVTAAAVEGVREAAKDQSTTAATALEVKQILGIHRLIFVTTGTNSTDDVRLLVERFGLTTEERGNTTLRCSAQGGILQPSQIRVTVCVRMTNSDGRPVPDWLRSFGFSLAGRTLEASALTTAE